MNGSNPAFALFSSTSTGTIPNFGNDLTEAVTRDDALILALNISGNRGARELFAAAYEVPDDGDGREEREDDGSIVHAGGGDGNSGGHTEEDDGEDDPDDGGGVDHEAEAAEREGGMLDGTTTAQQRHEDGDAV